MEEDKRVPFVKMKMKGATRVWWRTIDERNVNHKRPPSSTWEEMKEKLEDKYLPVDYVDSHFHQLVDCRKGAPTVDDFTERFHDLMVQCKVSENYCQAITRYKKGLRQEIQRELTTLSFTALKKFIERHFALRISCDINIQGILENLFKGETLMRLISGSFHHKTPRDKLHHKNSTSKYLLIIKQASCKFYKQRKECCQSFVTKERHRVLSMQRQRTPCF